MVILVVALDALQQLHCILYGRLVDSNGLEAAFEGAVLFDVLAVLGEGGGTDDLELSAGERGLEHVRRVHGPLAVACSHQLMHLVDEDDDIAEVLDLFDKRFDTALELSAELCPRNERGKVEQIKLLALQTERHIAGNESLGDTFGDGGLTYAGFTYKAGIVFGAAGEYLYHTLGLAVTSDDTVELSVFSLVSEIFTEGIEELPFFSVGSLLLFLGFFLFVGSGLFAVLFLVLSCGAVFHGSLEELLEERGNSPTLLEAVYRLIVVLVPEPLFLLIEAFLVLKVDILDVLVIVLVVISCADAVEEGAVGDVVYVDIRKSHVLQVVVDLWYIELLSAFQAEAVLKFLCAAHARHKYYGGSFVAS